MATDVGTEAILPSGAGPDWSPHHLRLHRWLLRHPDRLPAGAPLLLAVSGGQDSMALTALLADLRRCHGWRLQLWHGDHRWRPESGRQARELAAWAAAQGLELVVERAARPPAGEAAARSWRYDCLAREAERRGCAHVLTGHTASDRAETVLLHLARGSHGRGQVTPRSRRPLRREAPSPLLVRPLLLFSREDTGRICRDLGLPVWVDPGNDDPRHARNRVRAEVLPVLEALHPGASRRISARAERLAEELDSDEEVLALALETLALPGEGAAGPALCRRRLAALAPANRRRLLQLWLSRHLGRPLASGPLEELIGRLPAERGPGRMDLADGWQLRWEPSTLFLIALQRHG